MHKDEESRNKDDQMGFQTGWGKALEQLVEHVKKTRLSDSRERGALAYVRDFRYARYAREELDERRKGRTLCGIDSEVWAQVKQFC